MKACKKPLKIFRKSTKKLFPVTISELFSKRLDTLSKVATVADIIRKALEIASKKFYYKNIIVFTKVANGMIIRRDVISRSVLYLVINPVPVFRIFKKKK